MPAKATIIGERRPTAVPDITFSDRMTLELGGKQVELVHVGRNHSDNSIVMLLARTRHRRGLRLRDPLMFRIKIDAQLFEHTYRSKLLTMLPPGDVGV